MSILNAKITQTHLGAEDHGIFTAWVMLDFGSSGQGFGGYALDTWDENRRSRIGTAYGLQFIKEVLRVLDVGTWEKLPGTPCRVISDGGRLQAIGHFMKDEWFNPDDLRNDSLVPTPRKRA